MNVEKKYERCPFVALRRGRRFKKAIETSSRSSVQLFNSSTALLLFVPDGKDRLDAFPGIVLAPLALGDNASAGVIEGRTDPGDCIADVLLRTKGQDMLAVHFSPKRDFALVEASQLFDVHAKQLAIDGIDTDLDQIVENRFDESVRMKKGVLAGLVDQVAIVLIERLEYRPPHVGMDKQ
jgi:hypothetical protein